MLCFKGKRLSRLRSIHMTWSAHNQAVWDMHLGHAVERGVRMPTQNEVHSYFMRSWA